MAMTPMPPEGAPIAEEAEQPQGGYCIQICVLPTGEFSVSKSDQLPAEQGEQVADFREALATALEIYKQNPVAGDEKQEFEAGYGGAQAMNQAVNSPGSRF